MTVKVRFFAQFREFFGTDIVIDAVPGTSFIDLIKKIAENNPKKYDAIFDTNGEFHNFVILMKNGVRIDYAEAGKIIINDGDEIAVFPPVAGG